MEDIFVGYLEDRAQYRTVVTDREADLLASIKK
jgi:hypothetical protein